MAGIDLIPGAGERRIFTLYFRAEKPGLGLFSILPGSVYFNYDYGMEIHSGSAAIGGQVTITE
jgi:hypothetical protein